MVKEIARESVVAGMLSTMMDYPLTLHLAFDRAIRLFPHKEIVTGTLDGTHRYTYADFGKRVRRLAAALVDLGIQPGDRVASYAWNTHRHLELYFAVPLIGAVLHTVNFRLFRDQIVFIVNHAADRMVFADRSLLPQLGSMLSELRTVERVVSMEDGSGAEAGEAIDYESLIASGAETFVFPRVAESAAAAMCYTSGTTGDPKGVAYSHRSAVVHSLAFCTVDSIGLSERDVVMPLVPMFHANAWSYPWSATLVGAKQVFAGVAPTPERMLGLLEGERVTQSAGVPAVLNALLSKIERGQHDLSALRQVTSGGTAVPPSLIAAYGRLGIEVVQAGGMTETGPLGAAARLTTATADLPDDERLAVRASQGLPVAGVEARAVDLDGREVPWDGETLGELQVRGPWVTGSYYQDPRSAASFTADGWLRTGDIVTIDRLGYLTIKDRAKDVIKSGGEWISSVALENLLAGHPAVFEVAVIGVPDAKWDERPVALVVARPGAAVNADELREHLRPHVAKWWLPERFELVDELPKTSVGKLDKKVLRQRLVGA